LKIATEERILIEEICSDRIKAIQSNRVVMEEMVSYYLFSKMTVFTDAFSSMDKGISENDVEAFLLGNNMIQEELSGKSLFKDMNEFENIMLSDTALKF